MIVEIIKVQGALLYLGIEEFLEGENYREQLTSLLPIARRIQTLSDNGDGLSILRAMGRFHWDIATFSGNRFLLETLRKLHPNIYFANLVERAGSEAIARCARRYDLVMQALDRRDAIEAIEITRSMKDTLIRASTRRTGTAQQHWAILAGVGSD